MKKNFYSIKKPKWGLIALFMTFCCLFANSAMAQNFPTSTATNDVLVWTGNVSSDWNNAGNWFVQSRATTGVAGTSLYPGQVDLDDWAYIPSNGANAPKIPTGVTITVGRTFVTNQYNATGGTLTIESGATLTVNAATVAPFSLNGGNVVNNGTITITTSSAGSTGFPVYGFICGNPSLLPTVPTEWSYSGSGSLSISLPNANLASSAAIVATGNSGTTTTPTNNANVTYRLALNNTSISFNQATLLGISAIRGVGGNNANKLIIDGAGLTLGTVGSPSIGSLIGLGGGTSVTVESGTTLTLNSAIGNLNSGIAGFSSSANATNFTNKGTINILGASTRSGIGLSTGASATASVFNINNEGLLNVNLNAVTVGHSAYNIGNGGGGTANAGSVINVNNTSTGVLTLKNTSTIVGTGNAIYCTTAGEGARSIFNNAGIINLEGTVYNFGTKTTINNNHIINSNSEMRSFTAINNNAGGSINFVKTADTANSKLVTFNGVLTSATASLGAIYTDGTNQYTVVVQKFTFGTTLSTNTLTSSDTASISTTSGTLTLVSGTGNATIAYTATAAVVDPPAAAIASFTASSAKGAISSSTPNSGTISTGTGSTYLTSLSSVGSSSATSVFSPGGSGKGVAEFNKYSWYYIYGTAKIDVSGNTTAGVDYDQLNNSVDYGGFDITNATLDVTGIYTPSGTLATPIDIMSTGTLAPLVGTFASVVGLTPGWSVVYSAPVGETIDPATSAPYVPARRDGGKVQLAYSGNPIVTQLSGDGSNTITQGCEGSTLTILGYKFTGATGVTVNGVALSGVTVVSDTRIDAVLPTGATTGLVAVTNASGTGSSAGNFTVVVNTNNVTTVSSALTYTWANNGQTYTASGTYTGTTTNCVTEVLDLTINAAFCVGATVGSATAGTDFKFYKDNKPTTAAFAGTQKLAAVTYFISSTPAGLLTDPRVAVTVTLTALVPAPAISSTESKNICKYIGTNNLVTFTAAPSAATLHSWTVPAGASIDGSATGSSINVNFFGASATPGLIGAVSVDAKNSLGCPSGKPKLLALTTKAPKAPKSVVLTYNAIVIKKGGNFVGDASKILTLTAIDESGTADHHVWTLPVGTTVVSGDENNDLVITVHLGNVIASNDPLVFSCTSFAGCASSTKTLSVARAEAGTPKAITLTDSELPLVLKITKLDAYTGALKTRMLTLTATENTKAGSEATSYKWVLPAQATTTATPVIGEANTYTSTLPTIQVNLANVTNETSFVFKVYGVNGNGTSLLSKDLTCTSAAPKAPAAIYRGDTGSGTLFTTYSTSCGVVTLSVPAVLGVTYSFTTSTAGVVIGAVVGNSVSIDFTTAPSALKSTVLLTARATTGTGFAEKSFTVKLGVCAGGKIEATEVVADDFSAKAYPNPSSDEFTIEASRKGANVKVYDMVGRLIENRQATATSVQVGRNYATGIYNVIVSQGTQVKTLKVIKK